VDISLEQIPGRYWVSKAREISSNLMADISGNSPHFWTLSRSLAEVSVVSQVESHPLFESTEGPWVAFRVAGQLDFALTGILSRCSGLLAAGEVSLFAVSTFDTDYFLVKEDVRDKAIALWVGGGIAVREVSRE
jgi:hypothetical protein